MMLFYNNEIVEGNTFAKNGDAAGGLNKKQGG